MPDKYEPANSGNPAEISSKNTTQELKDIVGKKAEKPSEITREDLRPVDIHPGETEIVLQRHGRYERSSESSNVGSLTLEAQEQEMNEALEFFRKQLESTPPEDREKVDLLVVGSDTSYKGGGKRSTETGNIVLQAARQVLSEFGLSNQQIINIRDENILRGNNGEIRPTPLIREPKLFDGSPKSEEFRRFLEEKYGGNKEYGVESKFFIAFESDWEKEKRLELGVEGPEDMADRMQREVNVLARYSRLYHEANPGRRLVLWAATHYDTISPFIKLKVIDQNLEDYLGVDYGAGVVIKLDKSGDAVTTLSDKPYPVPVKKIN